MEATTAYFCTRYGALSVITRQINWICCIVVIGVLVNDTIVILICNLAKCGIRVNVNVRFLILRGRVVRLISQVSQENRCIFGNINSVAINLFQKSVLYMYTADCFGVSGLV